MSTVKSKVKRERSQSEGETHAAVASPSTSTICAELKVTGRRRIRVMRRQYLINQPGEQDFSYELNLALGPDHGLSDEKMYGKAQNLRKVALKVVKSDWPEYLDLIGEKETAVAKGRFASRFLAESKPKPVTNGKKASEPLTEAEASVVATMAYDVVVDQYSLSAFNHRRNGFEREMKGLVGQLPIHGWWCAKRGCDSLGLATLLAETGDLFGYANPGKVWKRMGFAPVETEKGGCKACSTWRMQGGLTNQQWFDIGYVPRRRSVMWNIGASIIRADRGAMAEYYALFMNEKARQVGKAKDEGLEVVTMNKATADNWEERGLPRPMVVKKYDARLHRGVAHINNRAQRYMEKRLLRELWKEWRK